MGGGDAFELVVVVVAGLAPELRGLNRQRELLLYKTAEDNPDTLAAMAFLAFCVRGAGCSLEAHFSVVVGSTGS